MERMNDKAPAYKWLIRAGQAVKAAFFPSRCLVCGNFFHPSGRKDKDTIYSKNIRLVYQALMSPFLCAECSASFLPVESPICLKCGIPFKSALGEDRVCGECIESSGKYGMVRSGAVYDRAFKKAVHCLKYKGKIQLGRPLSKFLFTCFNFHWREKKVDMIIPVPLHIKKLRMRGFNPSFLLIRDWNNVEVGMHNKLPEIPEDGNILIRERWTDSQTGLGRKKRLLNIKNAFAVTDRSRVIGKNILIVDDVYTTGATANECVKTLLKKGANNVDVLTLGRAV